MGVKLVASSGGSVELVPTNTASNFTVTVPAVTASMLTDSSGVMNIGSGQIYKDSSGNVGIGTSSPSNRLHVVSAAGTVQVKWSDATNGTANLDTASGLSRMWTNVGLAFGTGAETFTERMRIDSSGNLLVGNTSQLYTERINSKAVSASSQCFLGYNSNNSQSSGNYYSASVTSASTAWYHLVGQSGNGSIVTANTIIIYGNGNIQNTNNSYGSLSDIKLKENVVDATPKLDKLMQVRVVNYNLKGDEGYETHKQIGVIAQELEQIFPGMVEETADKDVKGEDLGTTTKSVKYSVFVPMLIKAIQEQQALITQLQADVAALKGTA